MKFGITRFVSRTRSATRITRSAGLCAPQLALVLALALLASVGAHAQNAPPADQLQRHPLEIRALTDPAGVLRELPALQQAATASGDNKELALLNLAESNACRVLADWSCQRNAAALARKAAEAANLPELRIHGLILESRRRMALQDFGRAATLLSEADGILQKSPFPDLSADVYLAYSSLSYTVGKHAAAADYAERGLAALQDRPSPFIRIRLLRNHARATAQLGNLAEAQAILKRAMDLVGTIADPKLTAELHLEDARIARLRGDIARQVASGRRLLELATQLSNSQLNGLGHEVLGLAALNDNDRANAERQLRLAYTSFRDLKLDRDERRVLRALMRSVLGRDPPARDLQELVTHLLALKEAEAKLDLLARSDSLTGVANRRYFEERLADALACSRRHGGSMALLSIDIDRFKAINDTHGHPIGDAVIVTFAQALQACVRTDDVVARVGGDEFVLLMENADADSGESVAKKLLVHLATPIKAGGITLQVSASIGVAFSGTATDERTLLERADRALYAAKAAGRNTFRSADQV